MLNKYQNIQNFFSRTTNATFLIAPGARTHLFSDGFFGELFSTEQQIGSLEDMAERIPLSRTEKLDTKEKPADDVSAAILTPEDKTEGFEETGYGSAPGSSEIMSGAESSIWTSDDHAPEDTRIQPESSAPKLQSAASDVASGGLDIAAKPTEVVKKPTSRKPKLGFFKKASPSKCVASTPELKESLIPPEEEEKTRTSPRNTRSRSKFTSGLPKLVSIRKTSTTDKSQSCSPDKQGKNAKSSSIKSPVRKLSSGIPTSVTSKNQRLVVQLPDEEPGLSPEREMASKSSRYHPSESPCKAKSSTHSISVQSKQTEVVSQAGESGKADESSVKPKKVPKFTLGKFKTTKQASKDETPSTKQIPSINVGSEPTSSAFALIRKGIKKMDVSGKLKKDTNKKAEETCLIEKGKKATKAKSTEREDESSEDRSLNEPYVFKKTTWKPRNPVQEGGFLAEDMIAYVSSSEKDTTPTEMSTLSDSSSLVKGKSKSQHSRRRTLDSMSKVSSFDEEEVEGGIAGIEGDARPQLQRQTNVPDLEMEDPGDVFDSPEHKVTKGRESGEEGKG